MVLKKQIHGINYLKSILLKKNYLESRIKPNAIIFDWDNTLIDSWPTILDALNTTFKAFNLPLWTIDEVKIRVAKSMRDSFPDLFGNDWREAGKIFYQRYADIHVKKLSPLEGAENLLKSLTKAKINLSVVSNKNGDYLRSEVSHLDWNHYFDTLVGALDAKKDKPDPQTVDMALKSSGIKRGKSVWFVGDASIDLECAHNAGLTPILIRESPPELGEMDDYPPTGYFENCDALCKFVINL